MLRQLLTIILEQHLVSGNPLYRGQHVMLQSQALTLGQRLQNIMSRKCIEILDISTHMNFINNRGELGVLGVEAVDGVHGGVEVLDVLGVHLEEGGVLDHDVPDPLVILPLAPASHPFLQLKVKTQN